MFEFSTMPYANFYCLARPFLEGGRVKMYFFVQHDDLKIWFQKIGTFRTIEHGCSVQIIVIRTRIIKQDKDPLCN